MGAGPCQRLLTTLTRLPWLRQPGSQGADPEAPASSLGRLLPASAANLAPCWTARWPLTSTGPESEGQRVAVTSGRLAWPQHRWLAGVPGLGWSAWWPMAAPVLYQTPPRSLPRSPLSPWSSPEACFSFSQLFFLFLLPPLSLFLVFPSPLLHPLLTSRSVFLLLLHFILQTCIDYIFFIGPSMSLWQDTDAIHLALPLTFVHEMSL